MSTLPQVQKALKVSKDACVLVEVPVPEPEKGEVLIQNEVVASNPKDWKVPLMGEGYNHVEGSDTVGTIVKLGDDVIGFAVGDRVAGFSRIYTKQDRNGCYAQYTVVPANTIFHVPKNIKSEEAATIPLAMLTSCIALFSKNGLGLPSPINYSGGGEKGTIVINGASSSIGSYAIQLAKLVGWRVVGVAGSGAEYAKSVGADVVVDYRGKNKDDLAKELQSHGPISAVYDCISSLDTVEFLAKSLQPHGGKLATVIGSHPEDKMKELLLGNVTNVKVYVGTTHGGEWSPKTHEQGKIQGGDAEFGHECCAWFPKALEQGKIRGNQYRVIPNGLQGVSDGLELLKNNKVSSEKLVHRIKETPGL